MNVCAKMVIYMRIYMKVDIYISVESKGIA